MFYKCFISSFSFMATAWAWYSNGCERDHVVSSVDDVLFSLDLFQCMHACSFAYKRTQLSSCPCFAAWLHVQTLWFSWRSEFLYVHIMFACQPECLIYLACWDFSFYSNHFNFRRFRAAHAPVWASCLEYSYIYRIQHFSGFKCFWKISELYVSLQLGVLDFLQFRLCSIFYIIMWLVITLLWFQLLVYHACMHA